MTIYKYFSMRQIVAALSLVLILLLALLIALSVAASEAEEGVTSAYARREHAQRLVAELRQGADDLTRLARSFAATGDHEAERQYQAITEIRDGRRRNTTSASTGNCWMPRAGRRVRTAR
jgi:methyl-accepting chemotaxis protein